MKWRHGECILFHLKISEQLGAAPPQCPERLKFVKLSHCFILCRILPIFLMSASGSSWKYQFRALDAAIMVNREVTQPGPKDSGSCLLQALTKLGRKSLLSSPGATSPQQSTFTSRTTRLTDGTSGPIDIESIHECLEFILL